MQVLRFFRAWRLRMRQKLFWILMVPDCALLEISHRTKDFEAVNNEAMALFRELLNIPDNYKILFLGGGASTQFFEVPYNFLEKKADT